MKLQGRPGQLSAKAWLPVWRCMRSILRTATAAAPFVLLAVVAMAQPEACAHVREYQKKISTRAGHRLRDYRMRHDQWMR